MTLTKTKRSEKGFTLLEVLAVIAIIAILAAIALFAYAGYIEKTRNKRATAEIMNMSVAIEGFRTTNERYPNNLGEIGYGGLLDPWGHAYEYLNIADDTTTNWQGKCRRDKMLNPINSDYDLYSMGADGQTKKQVSNKDSLDDIIRANNGAFVGLAADY
ncbi:MAG TPA: prepilin-type N-terminal cleavage/methylation domain-containing protein [Dissulfurispiraceae bacterium]|nr:prepilin-type N-terminal cleavage/methylation domain-containing protein [Dissulfurispiraceae bacterium]